MLKRSCWLLLALLLPLSAMAQEEIQVEDSPLLQCEGNLDPWRHLAADAPSSTEAPMVRIAYLIPSNRSPQPNGVAALQKVVQIAHQYFHDQLQYNQFEAKSFRFETEADGVTPKIHVVDVSETDADIAANEDMWGNTIRAAQGAGLPIWTRGQVWLLVPESHLMQADGSFIGIAALGGSFSFGSADNAGTAVLGAHVLQLFHQDALTDDRAYDGMVIPEMSTMPLVKDYSFGDFEGTTLSSITSSWLGAYIHELGHAFGLPHDFRNDGNFHGNLMGNGLRGMRGNLHPNRYPDNYTRLGYSQAKALNTNHYFNEGLAPNGIARLVWPTSTGVPEEGHLVFSFEAEDPDGLAFARLSKRGDVSTEINLAGTQFKGQISTPDYEPSDTTEYNLTVFDTQGNNANGRVTIIPASSSNRAPRPFIRTTPPLGHEGDTFLLSAIRSADPGGNSGLLTAEWDLDNDGVFDTEPDISRQHIVALAPGNHLIRVRVTDTEGAQTTSTPVSVHVEGDATDQVTFTLVDASTDLPIPAYDPLLDGAVLNLPTLPSQLNIRANAPQGTESVAFEYGDLSKSHVENRAPYALFGDRNGDYSSRRFRLGRHAVTATAFTNDGASGEAIGEGGVSFTIVRGDPRAVVSELIVVDIATKEDLFLLADGTVIDLSDFPAVIGVRAEVSGTVRSVQFDLPSIGHARLETTAPFSLFGDINGSFSGGLIPVGEHMLTATPYRQPRAEGQPGVPLSVSFSVVDTRPGSSSRLIIDDPFSIPVAGLPTETELLGAYPNPFNPTTTIRFALSEQAQTRLIVYDMLGREVRRLIDGVRNAGIHEIAFEASHLPSGVYLYRLDTADVSFTRKMLLLK